MDYLKKIKNKALKELMIKKDRVFKNTIINKSKYSKPSFIIIGAAKSGTTSLFQYLAKHPDILPSQVKETGYFMHRGAWGLKWYLQQFPRKEKLQNKLTFEATPGYFFFRETPKRIYKTFPNIKLIVVLRDPVERAFSHWSFLQKSSLMKNNNQHLLHTLDERSFEKAVQQELKGESPWIHQYLARGRYSEQLKRWYAYFSKDQILILDAHHLKTDPQQCLSRITNFLQLKKFPKDLKLGSERVEGLIKTADKDKSADLKVYNATAYKKKMDSVLREQLKRYFEPYDRELRKMTGQTFNWMKN